ncbi:MAG: hypothetical protein MJ168_11125 [Clostridia bacterium]|nr:hypothetical protein [Clostridia bacterium]
MKKVICIISTVIMLVTLGTACGKKPVNKEPETTTTDNPADWTEFVKKGDKTVNKLKISDNEYELNYVDDNGNALKTEHYKNDKLTYYYVFAAPDKDGNSNQEYYSGDGKLFAIYGSDGLTDAKGKAISEMDMQSMIGSYNK